MGAANFFFAYAYSKSSKANFNGNQVEASQVSWRYDPVPEEFPTALEDVKDNMALLSFKCIEKPVSALCAYYSKFNSDISIIIRKL